MKRMKKLVALFLVFTIVFGGSVPQENVSAAEKKYKTVRMNGTGEVIVELEDAEWAKVIFTPEKTGVYLIYVKSVDEDNPYNNVEVYLPNTSISTPDGYAIRSGYYKKGVSYTLETAIGDYALRGNNLRPWKNTLSIQFKQVKNRVQKLTTKQQLKFTSKDAKLINVDLLDGEWQSDTAYGNAEYADEIYVTFTPKKTGYYRFYNPYLGGKKDGTLYAHFTYWNLDDGKFINYSCDEAIKLKKGVTYIIAAGTNYEAVNKTTLAVQYIKKKRNIVLDYNFPGADYESTIDYEVEKGSQLGLLLKSETFLGHEDYKFVGWYTKKTGGKKVTATTKGMNNVERLYAHWKKK